MIRESRAKKQQAQAAIDEERLKQRQQAERKFKIAWLGIWFHCHVCHIPSKAPGFKEKRFQYTNEFGYFRYRYGDVEDWNKPGDMSKCNLCHKWTCGEHIFMEICQKCAQKL